MLSRMECFHWLVSPQDCVLFAHVLFGDDISPPRGPWLTPAADSPIVRGRRILMFNFAAEAYRTAFCAPGALARWSVAEASALRAAVSPEGVERRWASFLERLGGYQRWSGPEQHLWEVAEIGAWRVRRMRHPSAIVDALVLRARAEAAGRGQGGVPRAA